MNGFSRTTMLEYHLQYNHYPPVPAGVVPFAEAALRLAADDDWDSVVELPSDNGTATLIDREGSEITARQLIEDLHLDCFLED